MEPLSEFFDDTLQPRFSHAEARRRLIARKNKPVVSSRLDGRDVSPVHARRLWYAVLLFLYREEEQATDEIWVRAREVVIGILRGDLDLRTVSVYLEAFEPWVAGERGAWVREVAGILYNLEQIGAAVADTPATFEEWRPLHTRLRDEILAAMDRVGMQKEVREAGEAIRMARDRGVAEHMRRAYWDLMEAELVGGRHEMLLGQIHELRHYLQQIVPGHRHAAELDPVLDVAYIAQRVAHANRDDDGVWICEMEAGILRLLKEYDSANMQAAYEGIVQDITSAREREEDTEPVQRFEIRVLKRATLLTESLYHRMLAWRRIVHGDFAKNGDS